MFASAPHGSALVEEPRRLVAHQVGRLDRRVRARDRELDALVRADRPAEDDPLGRVARPPSRRTSGRRRCTRPRSGSARRSCRRGCSGSPCPPRRRARRPAPRRRRRRARSSRGSSSSRSAGSSSSRRRAPAACRRGTSRGRRSCFSTSSAASCGRAAASGRSASAREVQIFWPRTTSRRRSRSAEVWIAVVSEPAVGSVTPNACRRSSPDGDPRQVALLLLLGAVPQQRAHRVHLRVAGAGVAAGGVDLLEDHARRGDRRGRRRRTPPGSAPRASRPRSAPDELLRVAVGLELAPVLAREIRRRARAPPRGSRPSSSGEREVHVSSAPSSRRRAMISCWISFDPSPIRSSGASR